MKQENRLFKKVNKIDKPLGRLMNIKRQHTLKRYKRYIKEHLYLYTSNRNFKLTTKNSV